MDRQRRCSSCCCCCWSWLTTMTKKAEASAGFAEGAHRKMLSKMGAQMSEARKKRLKTTTPAQECGGKTPQQVKQPPSSVFWWRWRRQSPVGEGIEMNARQLYQAPATEKEVAKTPGRRPKKKKKKTATISQTLVEAHARKQQRLPHRCFLVALPTASPLQPRPPKKRPLFQPLYWRKLLPAQPDFAPWIAQTQALPDPPRRHLCPPW